MRLIDADAVVTALRVAAKHMHTSDSEWLKGYVDGLDAASNAIEEAPTIDAEPVRHGRWICNYIDNYECSVCGALHNLYVGRTKYCHNCGAKMDAKGGETDGRT